MTMANDNRPDPHPTPIPEWNVAIRTTQGLGHVFAFGFDGAAGMWVVFDPLRHRTEIALISPVYFDWWLVEAIQGYEVYRIAAQDRAMVLFPGLWCVGAVKRLVGIRSGALSPAGLRRDLIRAGAQRVFNRESQTDNRSGRSCDHRGS